MATNTAGSTARYYNKQLVHYLRADFNVAEVDVSGGKTKTLGIIPAGAVIIGSASGVAVHIAFDDTTVVDIGVAGNNDLFATNMITTTLGWVPFDEAIAHKVYVDTTLECTLIPSGTSVTVGSASVIVCYIPANEGAATWLGAQS